MKRFMSAVAALATLLISGSAGAAEILNIGDPAPPLSLSGWAKGEKTEKLEPNDTYVVEFWATWCGPCRASIPHLTELSQQFEHKGVHFIGVDVWEDDIKLVQPFVDEMGEKMDYAVALDTVPDGKGSMQGMMAEGWLAAAAERGIPTAFVIQNSKIAWIGHPMDLEEPLAKIVAGRWDVAQKAKERLSRMMLEFKGRFADDQPISAKRFPSIELAWLCRGMWIGNGGLELGNKLLEQYHDNAAGLSNHFWAIVDPNQKTELDPRVAELALKAARRAVELTKERDASCLDTLAAAQFRTGDNAAAVATQEQSIRVLKEKFKDLSDAVLKPYNDRLDMYRNKAAEQH